MTSHNRPAEKPIYICISSLKQLVEAKPPFSPLLWEFMRNVYPGGISYIVSKGDWPFKLVKTAQKSKCLYLSLLSSSHTLKVSAM